MDSLKWRMSLLERVVIAEFSIIFLSSTTLRQAGQHNDVPDGWSWYALVSRLRVPPRLLPLRHHVTRCTFGNLHLRSPVHRVVLLLLHTHRGGSHHFPAHILSVTGMFVVMLHAVFSFKIFLSPMIYFSGKKLPKPAPISHCYSIRSLHSPWIIFLRLKVVD